MSALTPHLPMQQRCDRRGSVVMGVAFTPTQQAIVCATTNIFIGDCRHHAEPVSSLRCLVALPRAWAGGYLVIRRSPNVWPVAWPNARPGLRWRPYQILVGLRRPCYADKDEAALTGTGGADCARHSSRLRPMANRGDRSEIAALGLRRSSPLRTRRKSLANP